MSIESQGFNSTDIAVIGMSLKTPGADNLDEFWNIIKNGHNVVTDYSNIDEKKVLMYEQKVSGKQKFIKANTNIKGIELFDADFFDINAKDASNMDPQQRLFLECAWHALENAGYDSKQYDGLIGMYAGVYANYYLLANLYSSLSDSNLFSEMQYMMSNEKDHTTTFAAYKMDLNGPVVTVQSACSTSLAAVHMACESLLNYSSDIILAGAATLTIPQRPGYYYYEGGLISKDGNCRPYDVDATGTIYSDGVGVVVLKRLSDAIEDGDTIHAIIKGSAMNNDGALRVGYTAPGVKGQQEVISRALMISGVEAESITYIEGHGTGTPLGDSIELQALQNAFRNLTDKVGFCALGSLKSNLGHLGPASGVCGMIKTILSMKNRVIPPNINFEMPNENLDVFNSPLYINTELTPWVTKTYPIRAGVSSFGLGGTNVHIILEEAPKINFNKTQSDKNKLLIISARSYSALRKKIEDLYYFFDKHPDVNLDDTAYTLQVGRRSFEHRCYITLKCIKELKEAIANNGKGFKVSYVDNKHKSSVFYVLNNDSMCDDIFINELCKEEGYFNELWCKCNSIIKDRYLTDINNLNDNDIHYNTTKNLRKFVEQYCIGSAFIDLGVIPKGLIGDGIGIFVNAVLANVFDFKDGLELMRLYNCIKSSDNNKKYISEYLQYLKNISYKKERFINYTSFEGEKLKMAEVSSIDFWINIVEKRFDLYDSIVDVKNNDEIFIFFNAIRDKSVFNKLNNKNCILLKDINNDKGNIENIYNALGELWLKGININWNNYHRSEKRKRIPLPLYPFERKRYWVDAKEYKTSNKKFSKKSSYIYLYGEKLKNYVPPRNEIEDIISEVWEDTLGIKPVGIKENFFELGGNSLLASSIYMKLKEEFDVDINLKDFLENQTVEEVSRLIESKKCTSIEE